MNDPILTRAQVRRVDHLAITRMGISGIVLMENAGRGAAELIRETYGERGSAVIICGPGNNGGDGFVVARHLHNAGWAVRMVVTAAREKMTPDALANFTIVESMGMAPIVAGEPAGQAAFLNTIAAGDIVVDALLGTGFTGTVRSPAAELIQSVNRIAKRAVVALDIPSGLDCDTGEPSNATIRANLTVTFVAAKPGLIVPQALPYVGRLEVADIGAPRELIREVLEDGLP